MNHTFLYLFFTTKSVMQIAWPHDCATLILSLELLKISFQEIMTFDVDLTKYIFESSPLEVIVYLLLLQQLQGRRVQGQPGGRQRKKKKKRFQSRNYQKAVTKVKILLFQPSRAFRIRKFFLSANHGGRQYFSVFHGPPTLKSISPALSYDFSLHFFHDSVIICLSVSHIQIHLLTLLDNFVNSLR